MSSDIIIGAIVQTAVFLLGVYGMILKNDASNKSLKLELSQMKEELKKLAEVVTMQAVQTTRIDNLRENLVMLQKTVEELRRGTGWIQGKRTGIEGEYPGG